MFLVQYDDGIGPEDHRVGRFGPGGAGYGLGLGLRGPHDIGGGIVFQRGGGFGADHSALMVKSMPRLPSSSRLRERMRRDNGGEARGMRRKAWFLARFWSFSSLCYWKKFTEGASLTSQRNLKGVTMSSTRKLSSRLTQLLNYSTAMTTGSS